MTLAMNEREAAAWGRLQDALRNTTPGCEGDDRYITDDLAPDEIEDMRAICAHCPLLTECRDFAATATTLAGFWAGRGRGYKTTKGNTR